MQENGVNRVLVGLGGGYYSANVVRALLEGASYEQAFEQVPYHGSLHPDSYGLIVKIHELVVMFSPSNAWLWLDVATKRLVNSTTNLPYTAGTFLGLVKAGIWLDEKWPGFTNFQDNLLMALARAICNPDKPLFGCDFEKSDCGRELSGAMSTYFFPSDLVKKQSRAREVHGAMRYIVDHGNDEKFGSIDRFVISRMAHGLLARMSPMEAIRAISTSPNV